MDAPTLAVEVNKACEVLTDLRYFRDEASTSAALRTICRLLNEAAGGEERSFIYQVATSAGGVSALLGIIRCCPSISVLADAASCLSLLVQGNERAALDLASRDVLSPLLPLLYPRKQQHSSSSDERSKYPLSSHSRFLWTRERLPLYEAASSALRKLTYHSSDLERTLAQRGGIRLIIELSISPEFLAETSCYSPTAKKEFAKLTLGQKYMANAAPAPKTTRSDLLERFPALASLEHGPEYPYYVVDLVTYERKWVVDSIIDTGLVWPNHAPFPEGAEPVWTCVGVVCVEDPGHVWCQFCIDKPKPKVDAMVAALRSMAPPTGDEVIDDIPEVGDFCIAYFEPKYCHALSSIDKGALWGRGQVLGVEPGAKLRLLSLDFGTTATLPLSHVRPFLRECSGIPPCVSVVTVATDIQLCNGLISLQAVPCKVLGVAPIPVCTVVQENAAGINFASC
ncbi:hypothetical protein GBAR_LOCUS7378 [Geodia barretti]|uniref:Tudor domain-containing protein n=1 Tax=Geodia barretti TaxID=519541 RepID=A0AA35RH93_GEOBA|nr:hypothetical protein GBAR_LOCUS7378 [Geodia barretti]